MRIKNIIVGFIILVVAVAGILVIKNRTKTSKNVPSATPSIQEQIEDKFGGLVIPDDEERIELKDVAGNGGMGIATKSEILADLPEPAKGKTYQAYLENSSGKVVLIGTLRPAKGGWILEYNSSKYPGFTKVIVMLGSTRVLEGSF